MWNYNWHEKYELQKLDINNREKQLYLERLNQGVFYTRKYRICHK